MTAAQQMLAGLQGGIRYYAEAPARTTSRGLTASFLLPG